MSAINLKLPQPAHTLEARIWMRLELEQARQIKPNWLVWKTWLLASLATVFVVSLIGTKLVINQAYKNQFNDLGEQLAIAELSTSLDLINLEWDYSLEGN